MSNLGQLEDWFEAQLRCAVREEDRCCIASAAWMVRISCINHGESWVPACSAHYAHYFVGHLTVLPCWRCLELNQHGLQIVSDRRSLV